MNWRQNLPPSYNRCGAAHSPSARSRSGFASSAIFTDRGQFFRSYLIAYMFWLGIPLGCLGIVMIHHLVGGTWGFVIQRSLESAIRTFPIMAVLFLPLLFGLPDLFIWAHPQAVAQDPVLLQKAAYLNIPAFIIRAAVYFAVWFALGFFLSRWSAEQDRSADPALTQRLQTLSGPGLVLYGLDGDFFRHRLADVAGAALVLDDFRHDLHGQPRADRLWRS